MRFLDTKSSRAHIFRTKLNKCKFEKLRWNTYYKMNLVLNSNKSSNMVDIEIHLYTIIWGKRQNEKRMAICFFLSVAQTPWLLKSWLLSLLLFKFHLFKNLIYKPKFCLWHWWFLLNLKINVLTIGLSFRQNGITNKEQSVVIKIWHILSQRHQKS